METTKAIITFNMNIKNMNCMIKTKNYFRILSFKIWNFWNLEFLKFGIFEILKFEIFVLILTKRFCLKFVFYWNNKFGIEI